MRAMRAGPCSQTQCACRKPGEIPPHESHYYLELLRRAGWIESRGESRRSGCNVARAARESAEASCAAREQGRRVALRDRAGSFLWRGKVLAAGTLRVACRSPDFGM